MAGLWPVIGYIWVLGDHWACSDELQRAPRCEGDSLASLTWYLRFGESLGMQQRICALHITLSPAISLVLCESCVEPPLACSTRKCKEDVGSSAYDGFYGSGEDQATSYNGLKELPLTHVLKIDDGHCSASNAAHKSIFFHFSLLPGACGE
ncbi:hypothetical protein BKA93DRAFT_881696 [Sparassis latifolia]